MKQESPLQKYANPGGVKQRNQDGAFEQRGGNAARDERRAIRREQRPPTFAELQEDGIARPAPPSFSAPTMQPGTQGGGYARAIEAPRMVNAATLPNGASPANPAPVPAPVSDPRRQAALDNLRASFGAQRQALNEDLARRGMWASTGELGAGGRLGDLAGQQARAEADLESSLYQQDKEIEMQQYQLILRLAQLLGLGGG